MSENEKEVFELDEDDIYDAWREECCIEFSEDLDKMISDFLSKNNHYMNNLNHIISGLRSKADYLEKYGVKVGCEK